MAFLTSTNISYYTLPAAWIICMMPRAYSASQYTKATGKAGMDVRQPRDFCAKIAADSALDSKTKGRLTRAEAAVLNGFENLGLFAAAVTAGNAAGLGPAWMNGISLAYLLNRFVYNHVYIFNETVTLSKLRTALYIGQIAMLMAVFVKSGMVMNSRVMI